MQQPPVSDEISAALARFFFRGDGPSHSKLSTVFTGAGYRTDDPYSPVTQTPNKDHGVVAAPIVAFFDPRQTIMEQTKDQGQRYSWPGLSACAARDSNPEPAN